MHPYGHAIPADYQSMSYNQPSQPGVDTGPESLTSEEEDAGERADEVRSPVVAPPSAYAQATRPHSSLSSRRYRTPMASVVMSPPPVSSSVPPAQPMPRYETPSAYAETSAALSSTSGVAVSYPPSASQYSRTEATTSPRLPLQPPYRSASQQQPEYAGRPYALSNPVTARLALERAIENVQTHLAALTERMDSFETRAHRSSSSLVSPSGMRSPRWLGSSRGLSPLGYSREPYTFEEMGMWSLVLNPLSTVVARIQRFMDFLLHNDTRSPALVVVRRLVLDVSFLLCLLATVRLAWRRSNSRRQTLLDILKNIWFIVVGHQVPRTLVDRGV